MAAQPPFPESHQRVSLMDLALPPVEERLDWTCFGGTSSIFVTKTIHERRT